MSKSFQKTINILNKWAKDRLETMKNMDISYSGGREHLNNTLKTIEEIGKAIEVLKKR